MSAQFHSDLEEVYNILQKRGEELSKAFRIVEDENHKQKDMEKFIDSFLHKLALPISKENRLSLLTRLIQLREDQLVQSLQQANLTQGEIEDAKEKAYIWVRDFHLGRHEELLQIIEKNALLSPFYRELLRGVHEAGVAMSQWQSLWTKHIINTINPSLHKQHGSHVMEYLGRHNLFDKNPDGSIAERSYSVLEEDAEGYKLKPYALFFKEEVEKVTSTLSKLVRSLEALEDPDTHQKEVYIEYFEALILAFGEEEKSELIQRWRNVDRAWMRVTSPVQVGHPLEYYEDHYRKAVALEWDVRLSNPNQLKANETYDNILYMYKELFSKLGEKKEHIFELTLANLQRVGLYMGRPALFYGSEFNGLFSAQVVPNDELVSKEEGKKIFAFADNILDSLRAKPFLKIQTQVLGKEFMDKERTLIFKEPKLWHKVYEITTIGHEYGHILWLDSDTESLMNKQGVFKNIEEFKATCGGLMAFFAKEDTNLKEYVLADTIKRAVSLIAWMQTSEVEPYYCEGLIHLSALFSSQVLKFDGNKLHIDMSEEAYLRLKSWYKNTYEELAKTYLQKLDAQEFLGKFVQKEKGHYMPLQKDVYEFVRYYWRLHKKIGREVDEEVSRDFWF